MKINNLLDELITRYNIDDCCPRFQTYLDAKRLLNELVGDTRQILLIENRYKDAAIVKSFIECTANILWTSVNDKSQIENLARKSELVMFVSYSISSSEREFLSQMTCGKNQHICYLYDFLESNGVLCESEFYDVLEGERIGTYGERTDSFASTRYYGAIYRDKKHYLSAEDSKTRYMCLRKLIFDYLFIRDFIYAEKYIKEYSQKEYPEYKKYQLFLGEVKDLLNEIKKITCEKKHFFWFWLDALGYGETSGMPFMNSLKGMVFEKAFTVTPTTSLTMKAIFLRKRFYEDCAYLIDRIEEKESQLIQYLASEGYKFEYIGFEERFEEKLYGRHVASYTPTTMLNWYLLCDICSTNQRKCYLVHDITESHPPFQSGLLEEFFHQIVSKPKDDREREERRMQWELGKYYLDEQISFLSDFINPDVPKIYMSDHASGMTDMSEVSKVGAGTHTNLIVTGKGIKSRQVKKYFSYINFDKLIQYIVKPQDKNLENMLDDYVVVEYPEKYSFGFVKRQIEQKDISLDSFGWKRYITDQDLYVIYSVGVEKYYTAGSWINRIGYTECQERIECLRGLISDKFGDVYGDAFFKNCRQLYKVWDTYKRRTGGVEPGILLLRDAVAEIPRNKTIAIRGGGQHTIELLSVLGKDAARIRYIIDIKKGMEFTKEFRGPGLYLEVIAPNEIGEKKIDVVIVSSLRYRKEIKEELIQMRSKFQIIDIYEMLEEQEIFLDRGFYELRILPEDYADIDMNQIKQLKWGEEA